MDWGKLSQFKCPKCTEDLEDGFFYTCSSCDFKIGKEKFNNMVNRQVKSKQSYRAIREEDQNQTALNNLDLTA